MFNLGRKEEINMEEDACENEPKTKKIKLSHEMSEDGYEEGELIENEDESFCYTNSSFDMRSNNFDTLDNACVLEPNYAEVEESDSRYSEDKLENNASKFGGFDMLMSGGSLDFQVLDDLSDAEKDYPNNNVDENRENDDYDDEEEEEDEIDEQEIDAMLDDGMPAMPKAKCKFGKETLNTKLLLPFGDEDFVFPKVGEKVLLVERGKNPFDILPEGWVAITHMSGMPVYLHKQSRVCTLSRPYFLGPGSVRKHDIPISAVPCLQYRRALEDGECPSKNTVANDKTPENDRSESIPELSVDSSAGTRQDEDAARRESASGNIEEATTDSNIPTNEVPLAGDDPRPCLQSNFSQKVKVQSAEEHRRINSMEPLAFREYCQKLFQFRTITIRRFQRWKDRRKHNTILKRAVRPTLPPATKLITCQLHNDKGFPQTKKKEFVLNPAGKSAVCILHEYAQHAMKVQPKYKFTELENSQTPYSATVIINDIQYGTGYASSKKLAKLEAARVTLDILIPEINKDEGDKKKNSDQSQDLSFFDNIKIEDPRLLELCTTAGHPSPFQILCECLQRNFGMGDTCVKMDMKPLKHQKSEFIMKVGKHEAKVVCKNKREGKQQASQAILQLLHPHIKMWGSLLRLYFKANEVQEKREEEHSVTMLQTKAKPNKAILNKLRQEMTKLYQKRDTFNTNVTQKFHLNGHEIRSAELGGVEL